MVDESSRAVKLEGFPPTMTIRFLVFLCLDVIDVGVRAMVRVTHKTFG
jgi:hypothetical protein